MRHGAALLVLVRALAGGALIAGLATVSRRMSALPWQTDGLIAAGWVAWLAQGGL